MAVLAIATSANLGTGFPCLTIHNDISISGFSASLYHDTRLYPRRISGLRPLDLYDNSNQQDLRPSSHDDALVRHCSSPFGKFLDFGLLWPSSIQRTRTLIHKMMGSYSNARRLRLPRLFHVSTPRTTTAISLHACNDQYRTI